LVRLLQDETEGHIQRLEQIFEPVRKLAPTNKCDAIEGILNEGKEIVGGTVNFISKTNT
jgi:ferritin-like metal-binding protein YciE